MTTNLIRYRLRVGNLIVGLALVGALSSMACASELAALKGHRELILGLAFNPDGSLLASASQDGTIRIWDVNKRTEHKVIAGHAKGDYVLSVAFSRDGKSLASGSSDKTIKIWSADTGEEKHTLRGHGDSVTSLAFSPTADILASSADRDVILWQIPGGRRLGAMATESKSAVRLAFSPNGKTLASAGYAKPIQLWNVGSRSEVARLEGQDRIKIALAYSPDGKSIVSSSGGGSVVVWDLSSRQIRVRIGEQLKHNILDLAVLPDSNSVLLASSLGARRWDFAHQRETGVFPVRNGDPGLVMCLAATRDGKICAVADDTEIKLFELTASK
ncbi:MAG TPA: WD40 repeat domain-containing protein [Pirellulales bacterium]|nr:WD40 repeat domain-containing protein [Pirellulales bacterium]